MPDVLVTGGTGFLGRHVIAELQKQKLSSVFFGRDIHDLLSLSETKTALASWDPRWVIHLAASVGGIEANRLRPADFFYDNAMMGINIIEACRAANIKKLVLISTVCAYPKHALPPFKEEQLWNGYPEETNAPYGIAKKMLLTMAHAYKQQYGLQFIYLLPANLYGPGDNFSPESSHVIPGIIRKMVEAVEISADSVTLWGSGAPTREFLHVRDAARAIVMAMRSYDSPEPVNIGTGEEISISDLAKKIAAIAGFNGEILWDTSRPDGQPRRCLDVSKAKQFGFEAEIPLNYGLLETVDRWKKNRPG